MFRSFFMAGFECATGYNLHREWIDQIAATEHDIQVEADYELVSVADILTVREGVRWPLVEKGRRRYDFASLRPVLHAAERHGIEPIWDLFHYGYPDGVDLYSPGFPEHFADYCRAAARYIGDRSPGPHYFTPVNEASYFAWAAGERGLFAPHREGLGHELKIALARAAIAAVEAIREACPGARIVTVDPICHVVPPFGADQSVIDGANYFSNEVVFQFFDMMAGELHPELGGSREHLGIVGLNYYWTNQWEVGREGTPLADDDPRRVPLGELVKRAWLRYGGDVIVSETSALGDARGPWLRELSDMACSLLDEGVSLRGICLYPILGMPEWHARDDWTRMGLWDLEADAGSLRRSVHVPMMQALRRGQRALDGRERQLGVTAAADRSTPMSVLLPRSAGAPYAFRGYPVWEDGATQSVYRLRVYQGDDGQWVAANEVRWGERVLRRVLHGAELDDFPSLLLAQDPSRVLHESGIYAPREEQVTAAWQRDVRTALAALRAHSQRDHSALARGRRRSERP